MYSIVKKTNYCRTLKNYTHNYYQLMNFIIKP